MSTEIETGDWQPSDALDDRLGHPSQLNFPEKWTLTESWQRAQTERDRGSFINDAEPPFRPNRSLKDRFPEFLVHRGHPLAG